MFKGSKRKNANEVERIHKEHQEELQAVNSKHVAELEDLKLLPGIPNHRVRVPVGLRVGLRVEVRVGIGVVLL